MSAGAEIITNRNESMYAKYKISSYIGICVFFLSLCLKHQAHPTIINEWRAKNKHSHIMLLLHCCWCWCQISIYRWMKHLTLKTSIVRSHSHSHTPFDHYFPLFSRLNILNQYLILHSCVYICLSYFFRRIFYYDYHKRMDGQTHCLPCRRVVNCWSLKIDVCDNLYNEPSNSVNIL